MGKIKVATLGSQNEEQLRDKQKVKREEKKKREEAKKTHIPGMKGGERIKTVGAESEEELDKMAKLTEEVEKDQAEGIKVDTEKEKSKKPRRIRVRSKRYQEALMKIDHKKLYSIKDAVPLLRKITLTKFDPSVELHINCKEKGLRGTISLPHGTGKQVKVVIADQSTVDKLVEKIEKGEIDFQALVAHPSVMPRLAKVARFLGPKGLMPNPKAGTISTTPEKIAKRLSEGEINWKTESDFPLIHQVIGKMSFKDSQLEDNYKAFIKSIGVLKITSITLKSSMSPGIKIQFIQ